MGVNLLTNRRRMAIGMPYVIMDRFTVTGSSTSNSYTSWTSNNYTGGEFTVTATNPAVADNPTHYKNGYFTISVPNFANNANYFLTADVVIQNNPLDSDAISLAPYGVGAAAQTGHIINGKLKMKFEYTEKSGTSNKTLEVRIGGKTMTLSNIKFWTA